MERGEPVKLGLWAQAQGMALQTPVTRNRYVDFLRALSILAVISGHWFMAAPHVVKGNLTVSNMLEIEPWTRWFTWGFQVMPIFFLVGGYARSSYSARLEPSAMSAVLRCVLYASTI